MSDQFTFRLPCLPGSSSSDFEHGDFTWKAGVLCATDGQTFLTLSCQPTDNKETLLWRCAADVEISFICASNWRRSPEQVDILPFCRTSGLWRFGLRSVVFNSHMKFCESQTELGQNAIDFVRKIVLNVKVVRNFIIDLSSPTNAFISRSSDAARFEINGRVVYLSKNMLTRCSPFFDAMFNRDFLEKSTDSYALRDVDFLEVMHLMAIIHRKTAFMDASSVGYLATLADMYDVREVAEHCRDFLRFHKDEKVESREVISERCAQFHRENSVIESKEIELPCETLGPDVMRTQGELEIGAFHCRLNLSRYSNDHRSTGDLTYGDVVAIKLSPVKNDRSVLWRCVTRSSAPSDAAVVGNDVVEEQHVFSFLNSVLIRRSVASTANQTYHFCVKLIESDVIDLSSPVNEFIKDPEDAVCLEVKGKKLWFSKTVLTLSCASFCDLFKEAKDFYVVDAIEIPQFLHFMALLHSHKFEIDCDQPLLYSFLDLLNTAHRFRCGYMIDRCESFLCSVKDDSLSGRRCPPI